MVPKIFLGREARSVVGRAEASTPYSMSKSPVEELPDQLRVGSNPSVSEKLPSLTEMEREGLLMASAEARTAAMATRENFILDIDFEGVETKIFGAFCFEQTSN
jgi:hypothetical protein